ncbi:hypothetical protein CL634_03090 [bacterium]|nr:hypothetical protein [bacterium]
MNRTANIRGYSWRAVDIVLKEAKRECLRTKSFGTNAPESTLQLEGAIRRVEQMLKEEPERFMEA